MKSRYSIQMLYNPQSSISSMPLVYAYTCRVLEQIFKLPLRSNLIPLHRDEAIHANQPCQQRQNRRQNMQIIHQMDISKYNNNNNNNNNNKKR